MNIYILCDMEGISGIRMPEQVNMNTAGPDYQHGRELMMADINAAVAGCFDGGATAVVACDTHGMGGQLRLEQMDMRAQYEMPTLRRPMPSLDKSYAGVILLGHHAQAGTLNGFLDHTMSSDSWFELRINDQPMGEIGMEAAYAGHYGVPVIMVSGDAATELEARALLGPVPCAVVKWGLGRNRARCLPPEVARQLIRTTAAAAVRAAGAGAFTPFTPVLPATLQLTYYRSDQADAAVRPGVERIDARTVRRTVTSFAEWHGF